MMTKTEELRTDPLDILDKAVREAVENNASLAEKNWEFEKLLTAARIDLIKRGRRSVRDTEKRG